jgi:hypothetical protein
MTLEEEGTLWANAFSCGEWIASLPIEQGQSEVEFVTPIGDLQRNGGTVKCAVVDDATGQPIEGATLRVDLIETSGVSSRDGLLSCEGVAPGRRVGVLKADNYADTILKFTMPIGETVDLGTVRMGAVAPEALFRVVDDKGVVVAGVSFELVDPYESAATTQPIRSETSASGGAGASANLHFVGLQRIRYLLRCKDQVFDAAPRLVEPGELRTPPNTSSIAEIVVRPAGLASFVLDPPIAKGTQVVIESPAGHSLREIAVDEFGVAWTYLLAGDYRLHLVEYGRATDSVDVRIDRSPFVFEIHR